MSRIKVTAVATVGMVSVMECIQYDDSGTQLGYKFIDVYALKEEGVIKRADSCRKAEAYLNTPEGQRFYEKALHMKIF